MPGKGEVRPTRRLAVRGVEPEAAAMELAPQRQFWSRARSHSPTSKIRSAIGFQRIRRGLDCGCSSTNRIGMGAMAMPL
jgi:hypothetical protein